MWMFSRCDYLITGVITSIIDSSFLRVWWFSAAAMPDPFCCCPVPPWGTVAAG